MDNSFTYYIIVSVIEAFILWLYCNNLFKARYKNFTALLLTLVIYVLLIPVCMLNNPIFNAISFVLMTCVVIIAVYKVSIFSAVFHGIMLTFIMGLSELLVTALIPNIYILFYRELNTLNDNSVFYVILSKTVYLFISQCICLILKKKQASYPYSDKNTFFLSIIPAVSIIIMLCLVFICLNMQLQLPKHLNFLVIISVILLLIINMFTFYIQQLIIRKNAENARLLLELQRESDNVAYYNSLRDNYDKQRILVHDIKEHLNTIAALNDGSHTKEISDYISELSDSDALKRSRTYCRNPIFNAILSHYAEICESERISFAADIRYRTLEYFSANDYASLFGNLLDNAVAAASGTPHAFIDCNVSLIQNGNADLITVTNSCSNNPIAPDGTLHTTKADTINHGLGTLSIKRIVDSYDGIMKYSYDEKDHYFKYIILIQHPGIMQ